MTGRPAKPKHWLAQKYAEERAREDAEAAAVQRQHELRKQAAAAQERRRQRAEELGAEWRCTLAFDREAIVSAMRHDAAALRDEGDRKFARAHEIAAELLEVLGHG